MGFQDFLDDKEGRGRPPARADHEGKGQAYTPPPTEEANPKFMKVEDAIEIVLRMAKNGRTLYADSANFTDEESLEECIAAEDTACSVIEDFFCTVVTVHRLIDLKKILMKLGNILVTQYGWDPPYSSNVCQAAKTILIKELKTQPSTDLIAVFTEFMNLSEEAREVLKNLGFEWSMPS